MYCLKTHDVPDLDGSPDLGMERTKGGKEAESVCLAPPLPDNMSRIAARAVTQDNTEDVTQPSAFAKDQSRSPVRPRPSPWQLGAPAKLSNLDFCQKDPC